MSSRNRRSMTYASPKQGSNKNIRSSMSLELDKCPKTPNQTLFETLMNDPVKRALVVQLLSQEKEILDEFHKKDQRSQKNKTPTEKVKKKFQCESPTALLRRRALEKRDRPHSSASDETSSDKSINASPVPFNKLLDGVIAYVEVKGKDGDRSAGAKSLMRSMGAKVMDTFTRDVTHVVFKDGSFTTYQKAKLMRVHLVSILWLEAVRSNNCKVPEKNYPALGTEAYDHNVSTICESIQKEYEEVVRDEYRRSLKMYTPDQLKLIKSRKTGLPSELKGAMGKSSSSSKSQDGNSEDVIAPSQNCDVVSVISDVSCKNKILKKTLNFRPVSPASSLDLPLLSSDSSDTNSEVACVNGYSSKKIKDSLDLLKNSRLSNICESDTENDMENESKKGTKGSTLALRNKTSRKSLVFDKQENLKECTNTSSNLDNSDMELTTLDLNVDKENSCNESKLSRISSVSTNLPLLGALSVNVKNILTEKDLSKSKDTENSSLRSSKSTRSKNSTAEELPSLRVSLGSNGTNKKTLSSLDDMSSLEISTESNSNAKQQCSSEDMSSLKMSETDSLSDKHSLVRKKLTSTNEYKEKNKPEVQSDNKRKSDGSAESSSLKKQKVDKSTPTKLSNGNDKSEDHSVENGYDKSAGAEVEAKSRRKTIPQKKNTSLDEHSSARKELSIKTSNIRKSLRKKNTSSVSISEDESNSIQYTEVKVTHRKSQEQTANNISGTRKRKSDENIALSECESSPSKLSDTDISDEVVQQNSSARKSLRLSNNGKLSESKDKSTPTKSKASESKIGKSGRRKSNRLSNDTSIDSKCIENEIQVNSEDNHVKNYLNMVNKVHKEGTGVGQTELRRGKRKLFNVRDSIDESVFQNYDWNTTERADRSKTLNQTANCEKIVFKKPVVTLTPVLLTKGAAKYLERKKSEISNTTMDESKSKINSTALSTFLKTLKKVKETNKTTKKSSRSKVSPVQKHDPKDDKFIFKSPKAVQNTREKSVAKVETPSRKSARISKMNSSPENEKSDSEIPITPLQRRSTLDFVDLVAPPRRTKNKIPKKTSIVCTRLHRPQVDEFQTIVMKLGGFFVEDEVSQKTSHLLVGENKRTINLLRALARGCWIVKHEWLHKSLEAGKWLPEEDYELTEFSSAVKQCRLQRQAFGPLYSMDIFQNCGPIYVARNTIPRCSDLQELIKLCKGTLTSLIRNASVAVGEGVRNESTICVTTQWVLDSVSVNKKKAFDSYLIKRPNSPTF